MRPLPMDISMWVPRFIFDSLQQSRVGVRQVMSLRDRPFFSPFRTTTGTSPLALKEPGLLALATMVTLMDKKDSSHIIKKFQENIKRDVEVQAYLTHDWMNDLFAKGTWCCWGPYSFGRYVQELQKPHERVFLRVQTGRMGGGDLSTVLLRVGRILAANDVKAFNARASPTVRLFQRLDYFNS
ncbi:flavin-containing amine oxidase [Penicillium odoratum]|uniref:flavin-containing amine oxidase n=1 Tax=Penicillium odoratum TaxID=1167516 RepID=UPI002546B97A|nr:flavin-containing amine oxidase [Penicillium odoratum]KAJ5759988.1 flavin-containing amine oxidase [Penicillium odoratum]